MPIQSHLVVYGKGLRRLRMLCGSVEPLPDDFDVAENFNMPTEAQFKTLLSDVYIGHNSRYMVAVKMIRSREYERADIRKVGPLSFHVFTADSMPMTETAKRGDRVAATATPSHRSFSWHPAPLQCE
jgi:hypothetical protein